MKFKEGNLVEVLRREHDQSCGFWFPGNIISATGNCYMVRYGSLMDHKGEPVVERVRKEDVRPQPPHKEGKKWMVGDVAEMFDIQCWRAGKIAKLLKNNLFVVKLFGSIQLKEFHESNIRIQQAWRRNKWSVVGKAAQNKEFPKNFTQNRLKHSGSLVCRAPLQAVANDSCLREKDGQRYLEDGHNNVKMHLPARMINGNHANHLERSSKDHLSSVGEHHRHLTKNLPLFKQMDDVSSLKVRVDDKLNEGSGETDADMVKATTKRLCTFSRPLWTEDSNQCSVASCSSNDFADSPNQNCRKSLDNTSDNSDAESSFPSLSVTKHLTPYFEQKVEADIHELEFHAYRSTVQALYASGPLSWEQESLLTNLRLFLHISDEEHLLHLRHLLSTQVP